MIHSTLTPPTVDQADIERGIAAGRRERSIAVLTMIRGLFRAPASADRSVTDGATA